jgi:integrase
VAASSKQSNTPENVKHRHARTKTPGIYTSSNGKPGGLRWEVNYTDPASGNQRWSAAFVKRQDALTFQAEVRGKVNVGTVIGNPSMTFRQLVEQWKVVRDSRVRASTAEAQEMHLRLHILPVLGSRKVRDISRATVLQWQAGVKRQDGKPGAPASGTINLVRATLSSVLDHAVSAGVIGTNPVKTLTRADKPKGGDKREKMIASPEELDAIIASVGRRAWMADVIEVALALALRLGEVCGLDWADVNFENNLLTITRSVSKKNGSVGPTKNGKAEAILLTPSARKVLARMHLAAGRPDSGPVFASVGQVEGGYRHPATVERGFADTLRRSGIEKHLSMHCLRHTTISRLANDPRVPLAWTQRFARHSSITITEQYIHEVANADVDTAAGEAIAAALS